MVIREFKEYFNILDESLIDIRSKYYNTIPENIFYSLVELDPTYKKDSDKLGTYGKWILNLYRTNNLKEEDFYKVTDYLSEFEEQKRLFSNKDIGQFKTLPDLYDALIELDDSNLSDSQKEKDFKKKVKKADLNADLVYKDDEWEVWVPKDYMSSCKLASGTEWCTGPSSKGDDYYFESYSSEGPLYILINSYGDKYQFHYPSHQYMDASDRPINYVQFIEKEATEGLAKFLNNAFLKPILDEIGITEDMSDDTNVKYEMRFVDFSSAFEDAKTYYSPYRRDYGVSPSTAISILKYPEDTFDSFNYDISMSEIRDVLRYLPEEFNSLGKEEIRVLHKKDIMVNTFSELLTWLDNNYGNPDEDEDNPYAFGIVSALETAISRGYADGAIIEALNDIHAAIKECFYPLEISVYAWEPVVFEGTVKEWKHLCNIANTWAEEEDEDITSFEDVITGITSAKFALSEPRYGWSGFDYNSFKINFEDEFYNYFHRYY